MHDSSDRRERVYLPFLDGMRALAALWVLAHHLWQFAVLSGQQSAPGWFRPVSVLKHGTYGVAVFLVISGYCLMLPIARRGEARLVHGVGPFVWRRAERLLPAYFVVLIASIGLIAAVPELREPTGTVWDITLPSLTPGSITSHVLLVHNWSEAWRWTINPPMWSIAMELQVYLVFALALLPLVRRIGAVRATALAFLAWPVLMAAGFGFTHPWMIGLFAVGMVCAETTARGRVATRRDPLLLLLAGGIGLAAVVVVEPIRDELVAMMVGEVMVGVATALTIVVLASTAAERDSASGVVSRSLSWGPLRSVGRASYSLYLVHYPIVAVVYLFVVQDLVWGVPASLLALTVISAPAILVVTVAVFVGAERPFLRRPTRRLDEELQEAGATRTGAGDRGASGEADDRA